MPIKIDDRLPAREMLEQENIFVMTESRAKSQDIRPLKILILNLMPTKIVTETQLLRLMSNTPLQVDVEFMHMATHKSKNTSQNHLNKFYNTIDDVRNKKYDGMIVTGAPVELMEFEEVDYWPELCKIMEWSKTHVHSVMHICWGAQAGLYYHYGVKKYTMDQKLFGVFPHTADHPTSMLLRGFDGVFHVPHSRYTEVKREEIEAIPALRVLASSEQAGVHIVSSIGGRQFFIMGHAEYDPLTLDAEYRRDAAAGLGTLPPENYYPNNDPSKEPIITWRAHGSLLFINWLNYFVYQSTPYDLKDIKDAGKEE
jgi:homoserine O-succinyltransferase